MSKLNQFLVQLTDYELTQFYKYRYNEFLNASKEKIDNELKRREIDTDQLDYYSPSIHQNDNVCPRCLSCKFYTSTEIEVISYSYASVETEVDYRTCLVCHFSEGKDNQEFGKGIFSGFGFIRALINRKR